MEGTSNTKDKTGQRTEFPREDNVYRLEVHCETTSQHAVAMNFESTKDEDVFPFSPLTEQDVLRECGR